MFKTKLEYTVRNILENKLKMISITIFFEKELF